MKPMGALQPGIPSPTIIPQNWHIIIIDLQDCFFKIPLHPLDWERFAFSLPYPSYIGPHKWYQWTVLPQGMMNSPTIAQLCLKNSGLIIAPEKIQTSTPYHYLGFVVDRQHITPQLTQIRTDKLSTLNDFQKLLGDINWIRPSLNDFQKLLGDINWIRPSLGIANGEGNGNPLQCSCLENPRDGGAWWSCRLWGHTESDTTEAT